MLAAIVRPERDGLINEFVPTAFPFCLLHVRNGLSGVSTRLRLRFPRCLNREYYEFFPRTRDQRRGNRLNRVFHHVTRECFRDTVTLYFEPTNASPRLTIEQNDFPIVWKMNRVIGERDGSKLFAGSGSYEFLRSSNEWNLSTLRIHVYEHCSG